MSLEQYGVFAILAGLDCPANPYAAVGCLGIWSSGRTDLSNGFAERPTVCRQLYRFLVINPGVVIARVYSVGENPVDQLGRAATE